MRLLVLLISIPFCGSLAAIEIDSGDFDSTESFQFTSEEDNLTIKWDAGGTTAQLDLQFIQRRGGTPAAPLIKSLGLDGTTIMEGLDPNYLFWVGDRDLEKQPDGWMIFFDRVPTRPYSVEKGYLTPRNVSVSSEGNRAIIEIDGPRRSMENKTETKKNLARAQGHRISTRSCFKLG
jgi:hypothetical protein